MSILETYRQLWFYSTSCILWPEKIVGNQQSDSKAFPSAHSSRYPTLVEVPISGNDAGLIFVRMDTLVQSRVLPQQSPQRTEHTTHHQITCITFPSNRTSLRLGARELAG